MKSTIVGEGFVLCVMAYIIIFILSCKMFGNMLATCYVYMSIYVMGLK